MTTVVTGATGFLGKRVCEMLVERGESVVAVGRNFSKFPALDPARCRRAVADLADEGALAAACKGAQSIVHSAGMSTPWGTRAEFFRVNVEGTRTLVAAARAAGVKRFVHVSSSSVMFDGADRRNVRESDPLPARLLSHYSASKLASEAVVREAADLETAILRPRAIFGPGDTTILPRLIVMARSGKLRIIGRGENRADFTYVDNVVDAILLARDSTLAGKTWFVSNDEPIRLWDLVREVLSAIGIPPPERHVPYAVAYGAAAALEALHRVVPSLGEPRITRYAVALLAREVTLDISAIKRDLGYRPRVSMKEGIASATAALKAHA